MSDIKIDRPPEAWKDLPITKEQMDYAEFDLAVMAERLQMLSRYEASILLDYLYTALKKTGWKFTSMTSHQRRRRTWKSLLEWRRRVHKDVWSR